MIADDNKCCLIINPKAGNGKHHNTVRSFINELESAGVRYQLFTSERKGHAIELAAGLDGQISVVVAVGGDGTVNEIVNGVALKDQLIGVVPTGTGNDFARLLGVENALDTMNAIASNSVHQLDIGEIEIEEQGGRKIHRCFVNTLGIGFDAEVAVRANRFRFGSGILPYLISVLLTLRSFRPVPAVVSWNEGSVETNLFLASVGNGTTSGGGFILSPKAKPDDGQLDLCLVREVSLFRALRILPKTLHGKHVSEKEITYVQSAVVSAEMQHPLALHADGEIISERVRKLRVTIASHQGRFFVGLKKGW